MMPAARALLHRMRAAVAAAVFLLAVVPSSGAARADDAAPAAAADAGLSDLRERIAAAPVLRGEFTQEKHVEGFRNPLRSSGRFLMARSHGVLWQTLAPFPSEVVLTRDRILSRQEDGTTRVEMDSRQQPALRTINAVMFALMGGDVAVLAERFEAKATLSPQGDWRLVLVPRADAIAQAFERVTLEGDRHVRRVEMNDRGGDRTVLVFSNLLEEPANLTDDEARRFE